MNIKIEKINLVKDFLNQSIPWWEKIYWKLWKIKDNVYWNVYYFFKPQHESIRKAISKSWRDLDDIVEDVLAAIIISFVEEEKGLDQLDMLLNTLSKDDEYIKKEWGGVDIFWDYYSSRYKDYKRLQEIYNWFKFDRTKMENYMKAVEDTGNAEEFIKIQRRIRERDTEYLSDIIHLREYLWT